ncbi:MAG: R3H domain-containing nucleic acid-binding protein [Clostridia bacterium]
MSAYERKIIHTKLQNNSKVKTYSVGEEPNRRIIIDLK